MANDRDAISELLAQRQQIDQALGEHQRDVAVMFTDIVGSTRYFEQRGDIEGLALIQRHNAILFPVVERHHGRVIKTIGDAIMAVFDEAEDGVRCAVAMQHALADEARGSDREAIHIRIGLHAGAAFALQGDVFGDTVNTASRVAHEAGADEIVISHALAERLKDTAVPVEPRGSVALKGKAEPLALSRVLWRDAHVASASEAEGLLTLEIAAGPSGLKVSVRSAEPDRAAAPIQGEVALSPADLATLGSGLRQLGSAPVEGYRQRLREVGTALFSRALPAAAREALARGRGTFVRLHVDDAVAHLPWELLHDATGFLALRFAMGRTVSSGAARMSPSGSAAGAGHALVVANPTGDLAAAEREGQSVAALLREGFAGEVRLLSGRVSRAELEDALRGCALLHVAAHARGAGEEAGIVLADGLFSARDFSGAIAPAPPRLVFVNACFGTDARGMALRPEGIPDLGSALLLGGVRQFLGPSLDVADADAHTFALRFYERALSGRSVGEAVMLARRSVHAAGAPTAFAAYALYGDPRERLPASSVLLPRAAPTRSNPPLASV